MAEIVSVPGGPFRFSLVSAVYNVAPYLPEFFASLEAQTLGLDRIEVILVDDGSTDESAALLREWAAENPTVRVLTKANGGQAEARNLGLASAVGEWVTFIDPDDWIDPGYFASVDRFITAHPSVEMVATNRVLVNQAPGKPDVQARHPLAKMFDGGDRLIDLDEEPEFFHGSAPATFVRLQRVRERDLTFDVRLRPNFEDGHFCARYVVWAAKPAVGFVQAATYFYRKRADNSSTLQTGRNHPGRYAEVPRYGLLGVLEEAARLKGAAPVWLQNMIIYELSWYFGLDDALVIPSPAAGAARDYFLDSLRSIRGLLDTEVIEVFDIRTLKPTWRHVLAHGLTDETWCTPYAVMQRVDPTGTLQRITYHYSGERPAERVLLDGEVIAPTHAKYRSVIYFGATLLWERTVWVPNSGIVEISADGAALELRTAWPRPNEPGPPVLGSNQAEIGRSRSNRLVKLWTNRLAMARRSSPEQRKSLASGALARTMLRWTPLGKRFRGSLVLMDRVHNANDSAEHLFAYLRTERPEVNAWFVIERGTKDFDRLRALWGTRVIAYRSPTWYLLILSCSWVASSHADAAVTNPPMISRIRKGAFNFGFLQHGVIKDDLSNWLNPKRIDFMVSSTPGEQASLVNDGTAYTLTTLEAQLTGLPRFDRLQEARDEIGDSDRRLVIVAPTWRQWLQAPPTSSTSQRRSIDDSIRDSEFFQRWSALMQDENLHRLAAEHGLSLCVLPHPNLVGIEHLLDPERRFRTLSFDGRGIYAEFARCHTLITDYSSVAFNAAFLERSVVYYQFDADRMFGGDHVGRGGYFAYESAGFGPLTDSPKAVVQALGSIAANGGVPLMPYRQRITDTFPIRDGRCCERTANAIIEKMEDPPKAASTADPRELVVFRQ